MIDAADAGRIAALYRYPVKGMSAERLERVDLQPGETIPFDRAYAIENGPGRFDPEAPRHLAKINFLMLMRDERLATLDVPLRSGYADPDHPARREAGRARQPVDRDRTQADRAVHRRLHEDRAARGATDRFCRGAQLLRRAGEVPAHRQPRLGARGGARRWAAGRPAAVPGERLSGRARAVVRVRLARSATSRSARRSSRCSPGPCAATRPTSIPPRGSATWPSPPSSPATGATAISASTRRWSTAARWWWGIRHAQGRRRV